MASRRALVPLVKHGAVPALLAHRQPYDILGLVEVHWM